MAWFRRRRRGTGSEAAPFHAGGSDGEARGSEDFRAGDVAESSSGGFFSSFFGGGSGDSDSGGGDGGGGGGGGGGGD